MCIRDRDIPEAGDKIAQSGLAAAGGTYHGGGAAGGDCKAHMIQNGPFPIGKRDIDVYKRQDQWIMRGEITAMLIPFPVEIKRICVPHCTSSLKARRVPPNVRMTRNL